MGEPVRVRPEAEDLRIHRDALVVDLHVDTVLWAHDAGADLAAGFEPAHVDVPRLRAGGVDAVFFAAWVHPTYVERGRAFTRALELGRAVRALASGTPGLRFAGSPADVERAAARGEIAVALGVEGGHALENSLERLEELYALGARYLTLTWTNSHDWADAAGGERRHGGLAPFGREVVRRMNALGMIVDVSHVSDEAFFHALEASDAPVIASHSAARSITPHPRNLTDDMLRALGQAGGVVGIPFYSRFLDPDFEPPYRRWEAEVRPRLEAEWARRPDAPGRAERAAHRIARAEARRLPPVAVEAVVRHIDRAVEFAGIDHVALGSDFDGIVHAPEGLEDAAEWPNLTAALRRAGYDEGSLRKILGGNALRAWREVERGRA